MGRPSKLTPEQWAAARRRWEGSDREGFAWLREEVLVAFGDAPSRPAFVQMARDQGWKKGGPPSETLKPAAPETAKVTDAGKKHSGVSAGKKRSPTNGPKGPPKLSVVGGKHAPKAPPEPPDEEQAEPEKEPATYVKADAPPLEAPSGLRREKEVRVAAKALSESRRRGRPPDYIPEFCHLAYHFCLLNATNEEIASYLQINEDTFYAWQVQHPEFSEAVKAGKLPADGRVAASLYMRATGYVAKVNKPMNVPLGGGISMVQTIQYEEYVAPDVKAAQTWLFNRRPKDWRANVQFTPPPPNSIPDTKWLDEVYERKQLAAREVQDRVAGRMERMGVTLALADSAGDEELLAAARVIDEEPGPALDDEGGDG